MKRSEFSKSIMVLGEIFDVNVSKHKMDIYFEILKSYTDEQIEKAFEIIVRTCKFFPKPAEIIELIEGKENEKLLLMWEKIKNAIRDHGAYESIAFEDRIINQIIESLGGWVFLCSTPNEEMKWRQKEFERLYYVFRNQNVKEMPVYVMGITEQCNRQIGVENEFTGIMEGSLESLKVEEYIKKPIIIKTEKADMKQLI